jgi:hypothetical protein
MVGTETKSPYAGMERKVISKGIVGPGTNNYTR